MKVEKEAEEQREKVVAGELENIVMAGGSRDTAGPGRQGQREQERKKK